MISQVETTETKTPSQIKNAGKLIAKKTVSATTIVQLKMQTNKICTEKSCFFVSVINESG